MVERDDKLREFYDCDGVQTVFPITFEVPKDTLQNAQNVQVTRAVPTEVGEEESVLTEGVDYNITGMNVTTVVAYPTGNRIVLSRNMDFTQLVSFLSSGTVDLRTLETALDRAVFQIQQILDDARRSVRVPVSDESEDMVLPSRADRSNLFFGFGETGEPIAAVPSEIGAISAYFATLVDAVSKADLQGRIDIEAKDRIARIICRDVLKRENVILQGLEVSKGVGDSVDISAGVVAARVFGEDYYAIVDVPAIENWWPGTAITDNTTRNFVKVRLTGEGFERRIDQAAAVDTDAYLASFVTEAGGVPTRFSDAERFGQNLVPTVATQRGLGEITQGLSYILLSGISGGALTVAPLRSSGVITLLQSSGAVRANATVNYSASDDAPAGASMNVTTTSHDNIGFRLVTLAHGGHDYVALEVNLDGAYTAQVRWFGQAIGEMVRTVLAAEVSSVAVFAGGAGKGLAVNGWQAPEIISDTTYDSSTTWVKPDEAEDDFFLVMMAGGGGSGAAAEVPTGISSYALATGGLGGSFVSFLVKGRALPATTPLVVGAGGASVTRSSAGARQGNYGGATEFFGFTAAGGDRGKGYYIEGSTSSSGAPSHVLTHLYDQNFLYPLRYVAPGGGSDTEGHKNSYWAGGSGGIARTTNSSGAVRAPSSSQFLGAGGSANSNGTATSGALPGGGGGGSTRRGSTAISGAGASGRVRVFRIKAAEGSFDTLFAFAFESSGGLL